MIFYSSFKKVQPFFDKLEKCNFSVFFKEIEPGVIGIRIVDLGDNMHILESMFLDFLKLNSDDVKGYVKFKHQLSFDYVLVRGL